MNKISNKLFYLYPFVVVVTCCTLVRYNFPIFVHTWPWILLGCIVALLLKSPLIGTKPFYWFLAYIVVVVLNHFTGDKYFSDIGVVATEIAVPFMACSLALYVIEGKRLPEARLTLAIGLVILVITTICTELINMVNPGIVRSASAWEGDETYSDMLMAYWRMGMSNYLLPHALPMLVVPCIIGFFRSSLRTKKIMYLFAIILVLFMIYLGGTTTALMLAILAVIYAFLGGKNGIAIKKTYYFLLFIGLMAIFPGMISYILDPLASLFSSNATGAEYSSHLQDVSSFGAGDGNGSNTSLRLELYGKSLNVFFHNFILGTQSSDLGGHSAIFDRFASLGLLGGIPFVGLLVSYYRQVSKILSANTKGTFLLSYFMGIVMLLTKNMWNVEVLIIMFGILPIFIYYESNSELPNSYDTSYIK